MPLVLMFTFLITKEAGCLQPGSFIYRHYRRAAEAALCEQPAARAAAAGTDARRAFERVAQSFCVFPCAPSGLGSPANLSITNLLVGA